MIPRIIHFIWIGSQKMSAEYESYIQKFKQIYDDYEIIIWSDEMVAGENLIPVNLNEIYHNNPFHIAFKVDILRYLIIQKYGGLYFDVDFNPVKKLPNSFLSYDFLGGIQNNGEVAIGFFGATPNNKIIEQVINSIPESIILAQLNNYYLNGYIYKITGPEFFNKIIRKHDKTDSVFLFPAEYFYPYPWWERNEKCNNEYPDAIAVHKWGLSWWNETK